MARQKRRDPFPVPKKHPKTKCAQLDGHYPGLCGRATFLITRNDRQKKDSETSDENGRFGGRAWPSLISYERDGQRVNVRRKLLRRLALKRERPRRWASAFDYNLRVALFRYSLVQMAGTGFEQTPKPPRKTQFPNSSLQNAVQLHPTRQMGPKMTLDSVSSSRPGHRSAWNFG